MKSFLALFFLILISSRLSYAGEVSEACGKTGIPVIELEFRQGQDNFVKIKNANLGNMPAAKYLKAFYQDKKYPQPEDEIVKYTYIGNEKFLQESDLKKSFMSYNSSEQRVGNPVGYKTTVLDIFNKLVPAEFNKVNWFLTLKDDQIISTEIKPATPGNMQDDYGAIAKTIPVTQSLFKLEIVFSNNASEPIPYLIPLIAHELKHQLEFKDTIANYYNLQKYVELGIVDEARAFDIQMKVYLALARQQPELFCNWLYVTWAYGEIPVPLSWTMASMEKSMKSGHYIYDYTKSLTYKNYSFLLNNTKTDLRDDLKNKIKNMNLKFVK